MKEVQQLFALHCRIKLGPSIVQDVGTWSEELGLKINLPNLAQRRQDLMGVRLVNTVLPYAPLTIMSKDADAPEGSFQDLLRVSTDDRM